MEIGHIEPSIRFEDGEGRCFDLGMTATLLSLNGAAWDGEQQLIYEPAADDEPGLARWHSLLESPAGRQVYVQHVGDHKGIVKETVTRKDGWTGPDGSHYAAGQLAPMPRVCYHLFGEYHYWRDGQIVRRVQWDADDYQFWFGQWFRRGGLLDAAKFRVELRDKLLDNNREKYGISSNLKAAGK